MTTFRTHLQAGARGSRRLLSMTWSERMLVVEAALCLAVARLVVRGMRLRWLTRFLGKFMAESGVADTADATMLGQLTWALSTASRRLPWRCQCLEQGVAGKLLLRRRGLSNTLYLGVSQTSGFQAHAWIRTGSIILAGAQGMEHYRVIATFADDPCE